MSCWGEKNRIQKLKLQGGDKSHFLEQTWLCLNIISINILITCGSVETATWILINTPSLVMDMTTYDPVLMFILFKTCFSPWVST